MHFHAIVGFLLSLCEYVLLNGCVFMLIQNHLDSMQVFQPFFLKKKQQITSLFKHPVCHQKDGSTLLMHVDADPHLTWNYKQTDLHPEHNRRMELIRNLEKKKKRSQAASFFVLSFSAHSAVSLFNQSTITSRVGGGFEGVGGLDFYINDKELLSQP